MGAFTKIPDKTTGISEGFLPRRVAQLLQQGRGQGLNWNMRWVGRNFRSITLYEGRVKNTMQNTSVHSEVGISYTSNREKRVMTVDK